MGGRSAEQAPGAVELHRGLRHDASQRHPPDRPQRQDQPHGHGGGSGEAQLRSADAARRRRVCRHSRWPLLLRHAVARPARVSEGAGRHCRQRERRIPFLAERAEGVFLPRRAIAGRQRTASGAAGHAFAITQTADRAVRRRQSGKPRLSHLARARSGAASRRRSGAARDHAGHRLQS